MAQRQPCPEDHHDRCGKVGPHGQIERYLERSGLMWTHLRPSQFMQNYLPGSITGVDAAAGELVMPIGDGRLSPVDVADVAEIAVGVLTGDGHENRAYEITGPEALTMTDIVDHISAATGRRSATSA